MMMSYFWVSTRELSARIMTSKLPECCGIQFTLPWMIPHPYLLVRLKAGNSPDLHLWLAVDKDRAY
jgi:hypothetical protein